MQKNNIIKITQLVFAVMSISLLITNANAAKIKSVSCSVAVIGSEPYSKSFVVQEGVPYFDDFSTLIHFKDFSANMTTVNNITTIKFDYFADLNAFNSIEFGTTLTIPNSNTLVSTNGTTGFFSNSGNGTANYAINCRRN